MFRAAFLLQPFLAVLQVADIGLDLPELQLLRSRLQQGEALQEQLDDVLGAAGAERASINSLKALQQQASNCGLALSGGCFQYQICLLVLGAAGAERSSINSLKALQQQASSCGLALSCESSCATAVLMPAALLRRSSMLAAGMLLLFIIARTACAGHCRLFLPGIAGSVLSVTLEFAHTPHP
jgi:hypothetical protein